MFHDVGDFAQTLLALSGRSIDQLVSDIRTVVIVSQLLVLFTVGFLIAGGVASYFYFETITLDRGVAAMYVAAEFLALMILTMIGYFIGKRRSELK